MSNKLKETDNKMVYYFIDDKINIKNLDPNKRKIDEKSYKNILVLPHWIFDGQIL